MEFGIIIIIFNIIVEFCFKRGVAIAFGICNIVLGHGFVLAVHGFVLALMALVPAGAVFDERFEAWMREELVEMRTPHGSVIEALSFCKRTTRFARCAWPTRGRTCGC